MRRTRSVARANPAETAELAAQEAAREAERQVELEALQEVKRRRSVVRKEERFLNSVGVFARGDDAVDLRLDDAELAEIRAQVAAKVAFVNKRATMPLSDGTGEVFVRLRATAAALRKTFADDYPLLVNGKADDAVLVTQAGAEPEEPHIDQKLTKASVRRFEDKRDTRGLTVVVSLQRGSTMDFWFQSHGMTSILLGPGSHCPRFPPVYRPANFPPGSLVGYYHFSVHADGAHAEDNVKLCMTFRIRSSRKRGL